MYTHDEVMAASLDYFGGNDLAANVFVTKYAMRNEVDELVEKTPDDMHRRMAREFARIERDKYAAPLDEEEIYEWFKEFKKIIPQGSPMYGIGNHKAVSLSNCFVIESTYDSYGGIFYTDEHIAQISKRRGGVGYDISHLRPEDMAVNNSARTTTGATSFMHRFSHTGNEVGQHGRRGAQMISMSVHHPSIERFTTIKNDGKSVTGANISVRLTDEFLTAVKNDTEYELRWPVVGHPQVSRMVSARKIWNLIIHSAWFRAEPGLLFWDNILRESPADCYEGFQTISTNPCYHPEALLLTKDGYVSFGDLSKTGQDTTVITDNRVSYPNAYKKEEPSSWNINTKINGTTLRQASAVYKTQNNQQILKINTQFGFSLKVTKDHHIATNNGMIEAQNLNVDRDKILISVPDNDVVIKGKIPQTVEECCALLMGLVAGDGTFDKHRSRIHLDFWGKEKNQMMQLCIKCINIIYKNANKADKYNNRNRKLSPYFITYIDKSDKVRISSSFLAKYLNKYYNFNRNTKHSVPTLIMNKCRHTSGLFYIAGILYCDGSVQGSRESGFSVRLAQSNQAFLLQIQKMLHANGIVFKLFKRRGEHVSIIHGVSYNCKSQYELISIGGHYLSYYNKIGFLGSYKDDKLKSILNERLPKIKTKFLSKIESIENCGTSDVYCISEPVTRSVIADGITARRCGEIPLSAYDSCRLMAINIFHCVDDPFTYKAKLNKDKLFNAAYITQRLMDDLVDLEIEKINQIIQKVKSDPQPNFIKACELHLWQAVLHAAESGRRTGTGLTALGDTIAALGLKYGSPRSIEIVDDIYKTMKLGCYQSSVDMAKEIGPFAGYDSNAEKDCPFIQRIAEQDPALYAEMCKYGRRNIACLTSAPTGSVSMVAQIANYHGTSSGIEPMYDISIIRRRRINNNDEGLEGTFTDDLGETWAEYEVFHPGVQAWMDANPNKDLADCPYTGSTAADISWTQRVKLQAAAQKHVDHAISSTINLPKDVKEEEVAEIYETAWEAGLKGVTVYRDGCRSGIIVKKEEQQQSMPKDRPRKLPCDVHHITVRGQQYFILVGLHEEQPYEVFAGKNGFLPKKIKTGTIIRKRKNFYKAVFDGADEELSPITMATDEMEEVITRLTSGLLRTGANMHFIVQQLEKVGERQTDMNSFARSVARALKKYIPDGTREGSECPECGADAVVREEGCVICKSCGVGKCL